MPGHYGTGTKKKKKKKVVKSSYLPGNNAFSKASQSLSSTVLSLFLTIARTISSASFFIADPRRKANKIGSIILSIILKIKKDREIGQPTVKLPCFNPISRILWLSDLLCIDHQASRLI